MPEERKAALPRLIVFILAMSWVSAAFAQSPGQIPLIHSPLYDAAPPQDPSPLIHSPLYDPPDFRPRQSKAPVRLINGRDLPLATPPTISPAEIDAVLARYNSPARGMGRYVYDEGLKYGINPAVALAFFIQESSAGTRGVAVLSNNWGNIKGTGPAGSMSGFRAYHDYYESVDDWYRLIRYRYMVAASEQGYGAFTVAEVVHAYAPDSDGNDEKIYVANVLSMVLAWSDDYAVASLY